MSREDRLTADCPGGMTLRRAALYFVGEALLSSLRSWRSSFLAVATIATSLFVVGLFLLAGTNLARDMLAWRQAARVVVYLVPEIEPAAQEELARELAGREGIEAVEVVSRARARQRLAEALPAIADILEVWEEEPLPPSLEVRLGTGAEVGPAVASWLQELAARPEVAFVDDDRRWLAQIDRLLAAARVLAVGLGAVLLLASVFTITSVIRLRIELHQDELEVMRLVGATEFFVRGPFVAEGLVQGLAGGAAALGLLWTGFWLLGRLIRSELLVSLLWASFLPPRHQLLLLALGAGAGLAGALLSLRQPRLVLKE